MNNSSKVMQSAVAGILAINVFIFLPYTLYLGNFDQVRTPIFDVLQLCLIPALLLFLLVLLIGGMVPSRFGQRFTVFIAVLSVLIWFQGNVISWDYGILNGRAIDWGQNIWRGWIDAAIWIIVIAVSMSLYKFIGKGLIQFAVAVFFIQLISVMISGFESRTVLLKEKVQNSNNALQEIYRFSSGKNVLHLMLDGFQADIFQDIIEHPRAGEFYSSELNGFVFYNEALAVFPYTRFAVPAFLGGKIYKAKVRKDDFIDSTLRGETILNLASDKGYEVDFAVPGSYFSDKYANSKYKNLYTLGNKTATQTKQDNAAMLIDMALFRAAPHFIKPYVYNNQKWLLASYLYDEEWMRFRYFKHTYFLNDLIDNMSADRGEPVYKYIHVMNTHNPMVVNEKCTYAGKIIKTTRHTLTNQSVCTLNTIIELFRKMKEIGVYDETLIVMHADHGGWVPNKRPGQPILFQSGQVAPEWVASLASPLLAIKQPNATGRLETSSLLVSLVNIPDTISDIMEWDADFGRESLLKMNNDTNRQRKFYFYSWQKDAWEADYTGVIQEYIISGSHYENKWELGSVFYPPES